MIVLSRHRVNDSSPPAMSAELMIGRVICRNARAGGAPRSAAASSSDSSRPASRARTISVTSADVYSDWPTHSRRMPLLIGPTGLLNGPPTRYEPAEQGDGIHDLGRHQDEEEHEHERLAPRARATGQSNAGQPAEDHRDDRAADGGGERVAQRQAETGLVEQIGVPVGAQAVDDERDATIPTGIAQRRQDLVTETLANQPDDRRTMTKKTRIAFHVLWTLNSAPHHLVRVVARPDDERTTAVERVADDEQDRDEQEHQHDVVQMAMMILAPSRGTRFAFGMSSGATAVMPQPRSRCGDDAAAATATPSTTMPPTASTSSTAPIIITAIAEPSGQFRATWNWLSIIAPIMLPVVPPSSVAVT